MPARRAVIRPCTCGDPDCGFNRQQIEVSRQQIEVSPRNGQDYFNNAGINDRFTSAHTERRARDRGQQIEVAKSFELQLDIDGPEAYDRFAELLEIYQNCPSLPALGKIVERPSRTQGNKHITIELSAEHSVEQRILLQALLGSDLKRELLSLASHHNGHENPIVFYRPQEESNAASQQTGPRDGVDADISRADFIRGSNGFLRPAFPAEVSRRRRRTRPADGGSPSGRAYTQIISDDDLLTR